MKNTFTQQTCCSFCSIISIVCISLFYHSAHAQVCIPQYLYDCQYDDDINNFTLIGAGTSTISDLNTGCSANGYADRTTIIPAVNLQQGGSYSGTVSTDYSSDEYVRIWIDFNNDQTFAASEVVADIGPFGSTDGNLPFTINVPFSAPVTNSLRMRVRLVYDPLSVIDPCLQESYGETHDYLVNILATPPCSGTPIAGTVTPPGPVSACPNSTTMLTTTGTTFATGLGYQWEESTNGGSSWGNATGGVGTTTLFYTTPPFTAPIQYRLNVSCGTMSAQTSPLVVNAANFYTCYCQSAAQYNFDEDIGNVTIKTYPAGTDLLNNGNATPLNNNPASVNLYTDYTNLTPPEMYRGNVYNFLVTQIDEYSFYSSFVAIYIDFNHNGAYDPNEQVLLKTTSATSTPPQQVHDTFRVPANAMIGTTGMRVVLVDGTFTPPTPCGGYFAGETEDYLVNINYPPCNGVPQAGIAHINDTLLCTGDTIVLIDTTHDTDFSGLSGKWETSSDGNIWTAIANSNVDTLVTLSIGSAYYRYAINCSNTMQTSYSNALHVTAKAPYKCYCRSFANGGINDISDVGSFSIGNFINNAGGPHFSNPAAIHSYTDNTDFGSAILFADSSYYVSAYHILRGNFQSDAKITLFIDFNNNWQYDVPEERVWTGYTNQTDVYINTHVYVPLNAAKNVLTGMRLIINNDVGPNVPSDEACGPYTSGETEDYVVRIYEKGTILGISNNEFINNLIVYPNPTDGKCIVAFNAKANIRNLKLSITGITGQQIATDEFSNVSGSFKKEIDLSNLSKGVYFLEILSDGERQIRKIVLR